MDLETPAPASSLTRSGLGSRTPSPGLQYSRSRGSPRLWRPSASKILSFVGLWGRLTIVTLATLHALMKSASASPRTVSDGLMGIRVAKSATTPAFLGGICQALL